MFSFLYWTESGTTPQIGRTCMDGTLKTYLVTTDIGWPIGLTIDFTCNHKHTDSRFPSQILRA